MAESPARQAYRERAERRDLLDTRAAVRAERRAWGAIGSLVTPPAKPSTASAVHWRKRHANLTLPPTLRSGHSRSL